MSAKDIISVISDLSVLAGAVAAIYGIDTWKRELQWKKRSELAEETLFYIYEVENSIKAIRTPVSSSLEYRDRKKGENETETESRALDSAYVILKRIDDNIDPLNKLRLLRQRCRVMFEDAPVKEMDELLQVIWQIRYAATRLGNRYWKIDVSRYSQQRRDEHYKKQDELEDIIWGGGKEDDIRGKIEDITAQSENYFRKYISPMPPANRIIASINKILDKISYFRAGRKNGSTSKKGAIGYSDKKKGIPNRLDMPYKLIKFPTKERRSIYGSNFNRSARFCNQKCCVIFSDNS